MTAISDQASTLRRLARGLDRRGAPARRCPVLAIASGKGGVGKTTLAAAMAAILARRGLRTALLDADLGLANADVVCGVRPTARLTEAVVRVAQGGRVDVALLRRLCQPGPGGLVLVPGVVGRPVSASGVDACTALSQVQDLLSRSMDVVVVDHGAGLGHSVCQGLASSTVPVVVTTPDPAALADAYALIKALRSVSCDRPPAVLVNRARDAAEAQQAHARIAQVAARFLSVGVPMLGMVPEDPAVQRCTRQGRALVLAAPRSAAVEHLHAVVDRVLAEVAPDRGGSPRRGRRPFGRLARLMRGR
ncbi:MAG: site-determining protein [Phycisphaerales bacterium]|nr:MAG: site-determining protein [Phycisphaerales bacterium]